MAKKILVVDDEPALVTVWETRLKAQGFDVITASNGSQALAKTLQERPDLILLDVMMPDLTGFQVFEKLQLDPHGKNIPIIVVSARRSMGDFFPQSKQITFLNKPIDANVLLDKIGQILMLHHIEENKNVLILGNQEFLVQKIKELFEKKGYKVTVPLNEHEAIQKCEILQPKFFFCQFWEELTVLDSVTVYKKLRCGPAADKINFYVYCPERNLIEALKAFPPQMIVRYTESKDLLEAIEKIS